MNDKMKEALIECCKKHGEIVTEKVVINYQFNKTYRA